MSIPRIRSHLLAGVVPTEEETLAGFSMIFWTLTITVIIKYIVIVMCADLNGVRYVCYQLV